MPIIFLDLCLKCPLFYECPQFPSEKRKCRGREKQFRELLKDWKGLDQRIKKEEASQ